LSSEDKLTILLKLLRRALLMAVGGIEAYLGLPAEKRKGLIEQ
jgi:hypothetical protein